MNNTVTDIDSDIETNRNKLKTNEAFTRTEQEWINIRDRALTCLAGRPQLSYIYDAEFFAKLAVEYERNSRDYKRQHEQITELQLKLNGWVAKDRLARGIPE